MRRRGAKACWDLRSGTSILVLFLWSRIAWSNAVRVALAFSTDSSGVLKVIAPPEPTRVPEEREERGGVSWSYGGQSWTRRRKIKSTVNIKTKSFLPVRGADATAFCELANVALDAANLQITKCGRC